MILHILARKGKDWVLGRVPLLMKEIFKLMGEKIATIVNNPAAAINYGREFSVVLS